MNSNQMYDMIIDIRRTRGTTAKKLKLHTCAAMKNILCTTYSPFIHFNVVASEKWITESGEEYFSGKTNDILKSLANGSLSGNRAKTSIKTHLKELTYKSGLLLIMIINKSFNFGLAIKSINEVFPGLIETHPIQLAKPFDLRKCAFPCYISPKLDGLRAVYKDGQFLSRNGHPYLGLSVLQEEMESLYRYTGSQFIFDGELMVEGEHFNEISGQIRAFTEADNACYHIFDIPNYGSKQHFRLAYLCLMQIHSIQVELKHVYFVPHYTVTSTDDVDKKYNQFIDEGYEGAIVKQENGLYEDARTWNWMKLKNTSVEDLPIVGIFEGEGKYVGMAGGIIVQRGSVTIRVGSGLSDSQRMYWIQDPESIMGRLAEIAFQEVTPDGSLRHPVFKKLRGDK